LSVWHCDFQQVVAILTELQKFLMEFGSDFSFVARQKRMTIGNEDSLVMQMPAIRSMVDGRQPIHVDR